MRFIGIAARLNLEGYEKLVYPTSYLALLRDHDFVPLLLPPLDKEKLTPLLELCSAFILPGGNDLDPRLYYQENTASSCDARIDQLDYLITDYAVKHQLPLLGICRGMQVINVYFHGDLRQHLKKSQLFFHLNARHQIKIINSPIKEINNTIYTVHSNHHQAVCRLGSNLQIIAVSLDGLIEGFMHESLPIIGLQWHPERISNLSPNQELINYFLTMSSLKTCPTGLNPKDK